MVKSNAKSIPVIKKKKYWLSGLTAFFVLFRLHIHTASSPWCRCSGVCWFCCSTGCWSRKYQSIIIDNLKQLFACKIFTMCLPKIIALHANGNWTTDGKPAHISFSNAEHIVLLRPAYRFESEKLLNSANQVGPTYIKNCSFLGAILKNLNMFAYLSLDL
jgi:hypothetical protein